MPDITSDGSGYSWKIATQADFDAASLKAAPLIDAHRYAEADALLQFLDTGINGAKALADLYAKALKVYVSAPSFDQAIAEDLFTRALRWRNLTYIDPHTNEEAVYVELASAQDERDLVAILGYKPVAK